MKSFLSNSIRPMLMLLVLMGFAGCTEDDDAQQETRRINLTITHIGMPGTFTGTAQQDIVLALAPGVFTVSQTPDMLFAPGALATTELESLAEAGNPTPLLGAMRAASGLTQVSLTGDIDNASYEESPILPGAQTTLIIEYKPGDKLAMAMMLGPSNDTFLGSPEGGIDLDALTDGELTAQTFVWWDAGTEVNEPIGEGASQLPATMGTDAGEVQGEVIQAAALMDAQGTTLLPRVSDVVRVTVTRR